MAGEAVSGIIKGVVNTLGTPVLNEFWLLWGVEKEKDKLKSNLTAISAVLEDAERQQVNKMVGDWLRKVKDAAYDAEDLVDDFIVEARRRKVENEDGMGKKVRNFFSPVNPLAFRFKMAHKIQELRERFDFIAEEKNNFRFTDGVVRQASQPPISSTRETSSHVTNLVVGRKKEKDELIDSLINSGNEEVPSVFAIGGMGGLGKTTLAQLVYNDVRVKAHFHDLRMWVYVSQEFDVKRLLKEILEAASKGSTEQLSMDLLQTRLEEKLSSKRYLLVLDDVWNENHDKWDKLKTCLKCGAMGSKILVTTRGDTVAGIMQALRGPHLETLSEEDSWTLFEKLAHPPPNLVSIGKEMVGKCGGLPLAVKTLGGLMSSKTTQSEWEYVRTSEFLKPQDNDGEVVPVLRLSYDHLSSSLKQCFAYCAVIPKGVKFEKDKLIKQWIAQGFVHSHEENELLEEKGEDYFNELVKRSLFQHAGNTNVIDEMWYKMHDLIHDLLRFVVGTKCLIVESSTKSSTKIDRRETCHLSLLDDKWARDPNNLQVLNQCKKLHSLFSHKFVGIIDVYSCFGHLRVLDLSRTWIAHLPNSIEKLKHLRYLDVSYSRIRELPETICNLHSLQTLILLRNSLKKLPKNMKRMISLRHIELDLPGEHYYDKYFPLLNGIGKLTCLRRLPKFVVREESGHGIEELKGLNLLRGDLRIEGLDNIRSCVCACEAKLKDKQHLRSLHLSWSRVETVDDREGNPEEVIDNLEPHSNLKELVVENYMGLNFPSWMRMLTNLVDVQLSDCNRCEHLPPLGQLPFLVSLEMKEMSAVKYIVEFDGSHSYKDIFPSLKRLVLSEMPNLKGLSSPQEDVNGPDERERERDEGVILRRLTHLVINKCPNLIRLPQLHLSPNLVDVQLSNCNRCELLPPLGQLPFLVSLEMKEMSAVKYIVEFDGSHSYKDIFPSLKRLVLSEMPNLKGLSSRQEDVNGDDERERERDEGVILRGLTHLVIKKCPNLIRLPQLHLSPNLESLEIEDLGCEKVVLSMCKSLKEVKLQNMPNLERCLSQEADDGVDDQVIFPAIHTLKIFNCAKLTYLPSILPPAVEDLQMKSAGCDRKVLPRSQLVKFPRLELHIGECPRMVSLLHPLPSRKVPIVYISAADEMLLRSVVNCTSLVELHITGLPEVTYLPQEFGPNHAELHTLEVIDCPKLMSLSNQLENLHALKTLDIVGCSDLVLSLSDGLQQQQRPPLISSLKNLTIDKSCDNQNSFPGDAGILFTSLENLKISNCNFESLSFDVLQNLTDLSIINCPKLGSLDSFENLKSLTQLGIYVCPTMMALPESMGDLTLLEALWIWGCPKITTLPEGLQRLTNLKCLSINECPILERELRRKHKGREWNKVKHVPEINIDGETVELSHRKSILDYCCNQ